MRERRRKSRKPGEAADLAEEYAGRHLNGKLLEHTRGCADTARKLAHRFDIDEEKVVIASYLHDIAKIFSKERQSAMAREMGMSEAEIDSYPAAVLHGPLAALIAREELGIDDMEILQAIAAHSAGCAGMSAAAKVVFVADYIEMTRSFPGADELRSYGDVTLDELAIAILRRKLSQLIDANKNIDPRAVELWNELASSSKRARSDRSG